MIDVIFCTFHYIDIASKYSVIFINPKTNQTGNNNFWFNLIDGTSDGFLMYCSRETTPGVVLRFSKGSDVNTVSVVDDSYNRGGNTTIEAGNGQFNIVKRRSGNNYIHLEIGRAHV